MTIESENQCDGCRVGAPFTEHGNHVMPDGGFMGCTKDRYSKRIEPIDSAADAVMCPEERELFDRFSADTKQRLLNQILKRATPANQEPIGNNWQERVQLRMLSKPENSNVPDIIGPAYNPVEVELRNSPKPGDVIELPVGVVRNHGSWVFAMNRKHLFCDKDYEKVIAFANKWHAEHKKD